MKDCIVCSKPFEPYRSTTVVCSDGCRLTHRKNNQRGWYKANRDISLERAKAQYRANTAARKAYIKDWKARDPERERRYQLQRDMQKVRDWHQKNYEENREDRIRQAREWGRANRDARRVIAARYKKTERGRLVDLAHAHARQARKRNAPGRATADQLQARWDYYEGKCWMCGAPAREWDHVIPVSRGGANWPSNLRPACRPCNIRKLNRKPDELDWLILGAPIQEVL